MGITFPPGTQLTVNEVVAFAAYSIPDSGPSHLLGYTENYGTALKRIAGAGAWGGDGRVEQVNVLRVTTPDGSVVYINPKDIRLPLAVPEEDTEKLRKKALDKLSAAEKVALGLNPDDKV